MNPLPSRKCPKHRFKKPMLKTSVVLSTSMIAFVYGVCPTLISTAILGEVLRYTTRVCISVSTIIIYTCQVFKTWYVLTNELSRMALYSICIFVIILKPRLKGFFACKEVWPSVAMIKLLRTKFISLKREKCPFCEF